jgi:AbrB family looped-hinge helix DNA binding protein
MSSLTLESIFLNNTFTCNTFTLVLMYKVYIKVIFMRVSTKGQVTIPYQMRTKLGMLPCTEVDFILQDDGILIQKQHGSKRKGSKLLEQLSGKSRLNMSTEYIMKLTRS